MRFAPGGHVSATLSPRSAELIRGTLIGRRGGGTRPDDLEWPRRAISSGSLFRVASRDAHSARQNIPQEGPSKYMRHSVTEQHF
jgi:hypothetical protein